MRLLMFAGAMLLALTPATYANAKPAATAKKPTTAHTQKLRQAWPAETLSGKISDVDASQKLVIVRDSSGTPFDFVVTPSTRIESGSQRIALQKLSSDTSQMASIRFIPEGRGDVAQSIKIQ